MYKFKFADIGEGLHEAVVGEVYFKEGDKVAEGDSLFAVETDKVNSDIPSPVDGTINKILINTRDTIHVGDITLHIDDGSGDAEVAEEPKAEKPKETPKAAEAPKPKAVATPAPAPVASKVQATPGGKVLATPFARRLAAEANIDISQVRGSGHNGRILADDIKNHKPGSASSAHVMQGGVAFEKPVTPMRKVIAKSMTNSWDTVAYTNLVNEVNMSKLWIERKALVEEVLEATGVKVSFTALMALATVKALKKFPVFNSKVDLTKNVIASDGVINLGIAVDTPKGLVVPTIKNAETKTLVQIAEDINTLAGKARDGKLTMADMSGGTFTITNFGTAGALFGAPVINVPELAILGTGAIIDRVFANESGEFYNGKVMNLTVAADHQWIDGAEIGRFNTYLKKVLENPILLLGGY